MTTDSAFWRDLEFRFRKLLNIPEAARLTAMHCNRQWGVHNGPSDQRERARLQQLFPPLARAGAIAAGTPNGADALDVWLNLLRVDTPYFDAAEGQHAENGGWVLDDHQDGWIQDVVSASAEYCNVRATRAFESETAAALAVAGAPADESSGQDARPAANATDTGGTDRRAAVASDGDKPAGATNSLRPKRLRSTVFSLAAARRMEAYMESNGIGQTEFAREVDTTDRTLRSLRRTGRVRRDIFNNIARAMKTTPEELLKSE